MGAVAVHVDTRHRPASSSIRLYHLCRICVYSAGKYAQHLLDNPDADNPSADTQHVDVVVLDALMCRVRVVAECGADARDFVRRDTGTNAGSTHQNAALGRTAHHSDTDEPGDIWEINRCGTMRAEIRDFLPLSTQEIDHWAFERKAGVIAANGEFHWSLH